MLNRTSSPLLVFAALLVACGTSDPPNNGPGDGGVDTGADATSDTTVDDTGQDTIDLDVEPDAVEDTADTTNGLALGDDCDLDTDCSSGNCLRIDPALEQGLCTDRCNDTEDCLDEWECLSVASSGGDFEEWCVPVGLCVDGDGDGYGIGPGCAGPDCNDADPNTNPAADEACDAIDNDCDNQIDENPVGESEDCETGFLGECAPGRTVCTAGTMMCSSRTMVADEVCDGLDNDCDGTNDESTDGAPLTEACYDGPMGTMGTGVCAGGVRTCTDGGFAGCVGQVVPSAEVCDMADNDCNGFRDEVDVDGDGSYACNGAGQRDCNDEDPDVYPGAPELCNLIDDNCNGLTDEFAEAVYYQDVDGDGVGNSLSTLESCGVPDGYVEMGGDCNDNNAAIYPGATEVCNNVDDDCNSVVDDGVVRVSTYVDVDGDGFGGGVAQQRCLADTDDDGIPDTSLDGRVPDNSDCNDSAAEIYPGAPELCDNQDNDCNGDADPLCAYQCDGSWPYQLSSSSTPLVTVGDMNQDGVSEIAATTSVHMGLIDAQANVLLQYRDQSANFARGNGLFVDVDGRWDGSSYSLEFVAPLGSDIGFMQMQSDGSILHNETDIEIYDATQLVARDLNNDGRPEIVGPTWGGIIQVTGYDPVSDTMVAYSSVQSPSGDPIYTNGLSLADLDGDGSSEVVFGVGYISADAPTLWAGEVHAYSYDDTDPLAWVQSEYCSGCFDTTIPGETVYPMGVHDILIGDDGAGGLNISADVQYSSTNNPSGNTTWGVRNFDYNAAGGTVAGPDNERVCFMADWNNDGTATCQSMGAWGHDVDGDGDMDRVVVSGGNVHVDLYEGGAYVRQPGTPIATGTVIRYIGDIDNDGRMDVLIGGGNGALNCVEVGAGTFNPWTTPPLSPLNQQSERTMQTDNWEPNDTLDRSFPVRADNELYLGYIGNPADVDVFRAERSHCPSITIQAPDAHDLHVVQYGHATDRRVINDVVVPAGTRRGITCNSMGGNNGLGTYWWEISSNDGGSSTTDPYRAQFAVNY